ncbi:hypothetical protein T12_1771 [Trichinella patagoniensis]|uniref:Uncharacterized protein n=1 Tax=Trichinella patagoniensis TaxID=990121 RepID=A0A0V0W1L4_9BILA|nr:hypothetical protein T12_1771 [Trichinella patagoniensis]
MKQSASAKWRPQTRDQISLAADYLKAGALFA